MDSMTQHHGTPWLDSPVVLHSSRSYECSLNTTEECAYQHGYWRFWYEADHRYALPTVAFFLSTILLFGLARLIPLPKSNSVARRILAVARYFSYRTWRVQALDWNSAPLGVLCLGGIGLIFFAAMMLGPKPYYWPTNGESWGNSPPLATRSGWLAIGCMPFVVATAGKSNFITLVTGVSHERLQVFHRWISYAFFVLALVHTFPFIVFHSWKGDMVEQWMTSVCYWTGVVALLAQAWLTFASVGPLRKLSYEWFKFSHYVAGLVFMLFFFFHCDGILTSWDYFIATGVLFSLSWLHRQVRVYFELGIGLKATVSLESNGFVRVVVPTKTTWTVGQHYFVRFLSLGVHAWTIHPFTACSLPDGQVKDANGLSELVFYIRPQGGLTARLAKHVETHSSSVTRVLLDGPYGGVEMSKIADRRRILALAGGSGAAWMLPLLIAYLRRLETPEEARKGPSLRLILATRDTATGRWFEDSVASIISSHGLETAPPGLEVECYYTGGDRNDGASQTAGQYLGKLDDPEKARVEHPVIETTSASDSASEVAADGRLTADATTRCSQGRPDIASIVAAEVAVIAPESPLGIFVCGPLSMQNDVANATANSQLSTAKDGRKDVYLHMEHFSWA